VQISPPLVAGKQEFDELVGILGDVLQEATDRLHGRTSDQRQSRRAP
jgi:adenosylmethionine-8-amino-7-oxononanoate aminotransferase